MVHRRIGVISAVEADREAELVHGVTMILGRARAGDERARGELISVIYDELRRVASGLMRRERPDHTLPPTAVVHTRP